MSSSYFYNLGFGQLGRALSLSLCLPAFIYFVVHIVRYRSDEKMIGIHTGGIIAAVENTHTFRYITEVNSPGKSMCGEYLVLCFDLPITENVSPTEPLPALSVDGMYRTILVCLLPKGFGRIVPVDLCVFGTSVSVLAKVVLVAESYLSRWRQAVANGACGWFFHETPPQCSLEEFSGRLVGFQLFGDQPSRYLILYSNGGVIQDTGFLRSSAFTELE